MKKNNDCKSVAIINLATEIIELYRQTMMQVKADNLIGASQFLNSGNELLLEASMIHAQLLSEKIEMDLLLIHAEDLLEYAKLYKSMIREIIDVHKKISDI